MSHNVVLANLKSLSKPQLREDTTVLPATLQTLLSEQRASGETGKEFGQLGAASTASNLILLRALLAEFQPRATLEVGLAYGASASVFADYHERRGAIGEGTHVAIDPYQSKNWDNVARLRLRAAGLDRHVRVLESPSCIALPQLESEGKYIDAAYVDGSHLFENVFIDFFFINRLLTEGGYLFFDGSTHPDVRKILRFITTNFAAHYQPVDLRPYYRRGAWTTLSYTTVRLFRYNQFTAFKKIKCGQRAWDAPFVDF
jgi:cephalosporin hydroxylase